MDAAIHDAEQLARFSLARLSRDPRFDGQFFVAVKSTGIFCRPICPARLPKEGNVGYYQHAAQAMHAGFRPCLRCRPDSAPRSPAWNGVNTTVKRAEDLLSEIPPSPVATIATRLGISERYLHKLMHTHTGISPLQWQKYQQLLFAKQLLQQTTLTVEQVAVSAGFGSARRLQSMMKNRWSLTPSQLKTKSVPVNNTNSEVTVELHYRRPYCWPFVRDFLRVRAIPGIESVSDDSYGRTFTLNGVKGEVTAHHHPARSAFKVTLKIDKLDAIRQVLNNLSRVLDLNADPVLIDSALERAGITSENRLAGIRLPGVWSPFEASCRAVLGQQVSVKAAIAHVSRLTEALGEHSQFGLQFPIPDRVSQSELDFLKMPASRKQALRNIAAYFATNDVDSLVHSADAEASLLALKGIGPWTVDYLMLRGLSHPDRFLAGDLVVRNMLAKGEIDPEQAAPWRSYLTFQLWQFATNS